MSNEEKIAAIRKFMSENPRQHNCSVLSAAIRHLENGNLTGAQYKVQIDTDKFLDRKTVLNFLDSIGMLSNEYREHLRSWGVL